MEHKIIVDSCCDLDEGLIKKLEAVTVPLTITMGDKLYVDDENLHIPTFMAEMHASKEKVTSGAPSPMSYKEAFKKSQVSFAVTLSSNLSGSYSSAMVGKSMAEEEGSEVHVFDSKSAACGETLIAIKINELIKKGYSKLKIISTIESFIADMKTYFVLEDLSTLIKNGRMSKVTGTILSALSIKPIMCADGEGNIKLHTQARGMNQVIEKMVNTITKSGKNTTDKNMVISHCNNYSFAEKLRNAVSERFKFKEIFIVATRGISTMYANDKGIIMSF